MSNVTTATKFQQMGALIPVLLKWTLFVMQALPNALFAVMEFTRLRQVTMKDVTTGTEPITTDAQRIVPLKPMEHVSMELG